MRLVPPLGIDGIDAIDRVMAMKERKKALAGSVVKIAGRDVMLSKKIMISIVMVPLLWLFYSALLMIFTSWNLSSKVKSHVSFVLLELS